MDTTQLNHSNSPPNSNVRQCEVAAAINGGTAAAVKRHRSISLSQKNQIPQMKVPKIHKRKPKTYKSVISDIFDGKATFFDFRIFMKLHRGSQGADCWPN